MHHTKVLLIVTRLQVCVRRSVSRTRSHLIFNIVSQEVVLLVLKNWRQIGVLIHSWSGLLRGQEPATPVVIVNDSVLVASRALVNNLSHRTLITSFIQVNSGHSFHSLNVVDCT